MAKERMLTVLVPIKDADATLVTSLPAVDPDNINVIYKYNGQYYRLWLNPSTNRYEYKVVVDREFPYLGQPLEIFDFTYDATRMGTAPTISAQGVMWYAEKDSDGNDVTLEDLWLARGQECHVTFNGENYYLKQIPTSGKTNEDARYKYDIDFVSERVVLEQVYFYDVVQPFVTEKPISESAVFSFFGDITDLAKRINASLLKSGLSSLVRKYVYYEWGGQGVLVPYLTYEQWNNLGLVESVSPTMMQQIYSDLHGDYNRYLMMYVYENTNGDFTMKGYKCIIGKDKKGVVSTSEEKMVSFDNNNIHEAIQQFKDTFELQYYVVSEKDGNGAFTGNTLIVVGDCEHDFADMNQSGTDYVRDADGIPTSENPFDYGVDDALLSKEKTNTTEKIITRITGIGSEENIPWHYPNPTGDGWIKPMFKINDVAQDSIAVDYPLDEGSTTEDSVLYEKYLKNRIGDVFQYGLKKALLSETSYKPSISGETGGTDNIIHLVYVLNVKNDYVSPKFKFELSFLKDSGMGRLVASLRDNTASGTTVGSYDSNATYTTPTDFQQAFIDRDGSVSLSLTAGHVYYLFLNIYIDGAMPQSQTYDAVGYHYAGREVGYTTAYNQYYPQLAPIYRYVHIREDFYTEDSLVEVGDLFTVYYTNNQHNIVIGYSVDGTPNTGATPMPRLKYKQYKDLSTGIIYQCSDPTNTTTFGYTANPVMDYVEWVNTFMRFSLSLWSVDGWYKKAKKVVLADYGLTLGDTGSHTIDITDTIEFKRVKYITPCKTLMPELYIKTDGERRFYDAINYPRTGGSVDTAAGETTDTQTGKIVNPIYQKENGTHYDFENTIIANSPKEHIESFEDIKPTIKEQVNYFILTEQPADWATNYGDYYKRTNDGEFIPNTSNVWPIIISPLTAVYCKVRIDVAEEYGYDELDNDEIWEDNDDGNVSGEYKHPYFFVKLRPLGFNLFDLALQEDMVLSMTTGHCGSCNFRIGVDENTGKNPVQIWEHDVYEGSDYATKVFMYAAGSLRRYVDTANLYYDTDGTSSGYTHVDEYSDVIREGFLVDVSELNYTANYKRTTYTAESVANGEVGSLKQEPKNRFEGDVKVSGRFIERQQDTSNNYVWIALFKDIDTYGTIMPSAKPDYGDNNYSVYIRPKSIADVHTSHSTKEQDEENADKFVLINIRMPQVYLRRAERELSKKIVEYMNDNNYQKFNFSIGFSRIFLADNESVDADLNENSVLYVSFNNRTYRQYVQHYTYKMTRDTVLPEISVDMNEELSVSRTLKQREKVSEQQQNMAVSTQISKMMRITNSQIMRRVVSRSDDMLVSGNIMSRDMKSSMDEMTNRMSFEAKEITETRVDLRNTKDNVKGFVSHVNAFNAEVDDKLKQVKETMETRVAPVMSNVRQNERCKGIYKYSFIPQEEVPNQMAKIWLDSTGKDQTFNSTDNACPTDQGWTDISWIDYDFE